MICTSIYDILDKSMQMQKINKSSHL